MGGILDNIKYSNQTTLQILRTTIKDATQVVANTFNKLFAELDKLLKTDIDEALKEKVLEVKKDLKKVQNLIAAGDYEAAAAVLSQITGSTVFSTLPENIQKGILGLKVETDSKNKKPQTAKAFTEDPKNGGVVV